MEYLVYDRQGLVGILTISRLQALNALNSRMIAELGAFLASDSLSGVRCLVITGAGEKAFVAGADIAEMWDFTPSRAATFCDAGNAVMEKLENLSMPTIAAVNGYALGGGCELALACDLRLASRKALFALPEVSLGIMPGYGGMQRLARLIGPGRAKEMIYTGERVDAERALALGLVNAVVEPEELWAATMRLAEKIADNAPLAVRGAKRVINASLGKEAAEAYRLERDAFGNCFGTQDQREAMGAFVEKRKPAPFVGA